MPPIPRRQLPSEFRKAVLADSRGIVRLSNLAGFPAYTALSRLLYKPWIAGTALNEQRLRQLARLVSYEGPVFRG